MEDRAKALILALLVTLDGLVTWATIEAGGANGHELNRLFEDTQPTMFILLALTKATLWLTAWSFIKHHPVTPWITSALVFLYGGVFVWNLGNLAVNL